MTRPDTEPDDYLWTAEGPPDPEIARLEQLLRPFGHRSRPFAPRAGRRHRPRRHWPLTLLGLAAALLIAAGVWIWLHQDGVGPGRDGDPRLVVADGERELEVDEWLNPTAPTRLDLGDGMAWFTLHEGSRLQIKRLAREQARFFLHVGRLEAFVGVRARPRFFQVDTPAALCVDLGCKYTLDVDAAGDAFVKVTMGQVAFENEGREVFIPRDAMCHARKASGAATPRFGDASPEFVAAVDAFDALPRDASSATRLAQAEKLCAVARFQHDTLPLWHLLQDQEPKVQDLAESALASIATLPEPLATKAPPMDPAERRAIWKEHLHDRCWR